MRAAGWCAVAAVALALGCAGVQTGPFVDGAPYCDGSEPGGKVGDSVCPDGTHCAFPAPGWRLRCMEGSSGIAGYPPDEMRRSDGGVDAGR